MQVTHLGPDNEFKLFARLEMCSVSTNGERASPAIALASSLFSLST